MSPTRTAATQSDPELKMSARQVLQHLIDSRGLIPTQCYIPTFAGNPKEDVRAWLLEIEILCTFTDNLKGKRIFAAMLGARGHALLWLDDVVCKSGVTHAGASEAEFWKLIKESLIQRFDFARKSAFEIRESLSCLYQITSVYDYANKFFSICGEFVDEELGYKTDPEIIAAFIDGLKPTIKAAIRAKDGATRDLMETVGLAKDLDTCNFQYRSDGTRKHVGSM
ncbi:hypothetical protein QCA50_015842 [Cerrena zonata]|uniref:Retrotransposon gag domain-containing protein n=1 Tax=Cerrena zonata TaxID=2478898 RepID=A0AAW0FPY2_9APHY